MLHIIDKYCQCCHRILDICWKIIFMDWPSIKVSNEEYPVSGMLSSYNHLSSFLFLQTIVGVQFSCHSCIHVSFLLGLDCCSTLWLCWLYKMAWWLHPIKGEISDSFKWIQISVARLSLFCGFDMPLSGSSIAVPCKCSVFSIFFLSA